MCGILGYSGRRQAAPILLDGLARLEYRGYDSAGIAVADGGSHIEIAKAKGRLQALADRIDGGKSLSGVCGIGHTRWATHGEPSETNAHPLWSDEERTVVAIHNGIVENYRELKGELAAAGYSFYSQTDTEVAVKLIDFHYKRNGRDPLAALVSAMTRIRGSYCFVLLFRDRPDEVWGVRKDNPLIVGQGEDETFLTSDVSAILQHTRRVYYLDNMEIARLRGREVSFFNRYGSAIRKDLTEVTWDAQAAEKGGFDHFMMKEIHEQAKAVRDTLRSALGPDGDLLNPSGLTDEALRGVSQVIIAACGSAYHAGVVAQYVIEDLARLPVRVELASEFRYRDMPLDRGALALVISQSGETADTLAALRKAKEQGVRTLAVVNVVGSAIAREADGVFYTLAGPEIAVATTKAYSAQLVAGYLLALQLARARGTLEDERIRALLAELETLPRKIDAVLDDKERVREAAERFAQSRDAFFLGRNIDYAVAMEGSLKVKEISYLHSEACAAGEMKHGPISLIEKGMLVVGVMTQEGLYKKTASNLLEVKSRGAWLLGVTARGCEGLEDDLDCSVRVPETDPRFAASLAVIPLQLLGYYLAVARGLDVDKPRNLAKSVTVE
ncbi:MAG: glutamine--fructose-6-phosphate transaminase (isomerizing) [Synergistaceae bacterium]|nr:glutamine--fructose-6-phosphate transaminase (isomerizing) [Synergistaceae bacterium]